MISQEEDGIPQSSVSIAKRALERSPLGGKGNGGEYCEGRNLRIAGKKLSKRVFDSPKNIPTSNFQEDINCAFIPLYVYFPILLIVKFRSITN